jgi:hypothetical protein
VDDFYPIQGSWSVVLYDIDDEPVDEDEDNEIEEEEINAALKRVLILLDQVNDLSKSAGSGLYT